MSENLPENVPPAYPSQPAPAAPGVPAYAAAPATVPGKTLGIVGLILAILLPLVGLILSIVAMVQSRKAGAKNGPALAGIIVGALFTIGWIIIGLLLAAGFAVGVEVLQQCQDGATSVIVNGQEFFCGTGSN